MHKQSYNILLKKSLYHNTPSLNISKFKFISGLIIALSFSFAFYGFLYMMRESFRVLSVTNNFDMWVLSDKEVHFYNLFFAFISVIISQSFCIIYWLDKPRSFFNRFNYIKTTIVNDQRFLNWYFLNWFSKLAIIYGIMFGFAFHGGFYVFSLYPDYKFVFYGIIIVLYFQTWNTIRVKFRNKSLKWLLISMLSVAVLSFGLSRINFIDYKVINNGFLKHNIDRNYSFELPESGYYQNKIEKLSLTENLYVVLPKTKTKNSKPLIIADNHNFTIKDVPDIINKWFSLRNEREIPLITVILHIHKDIKMKFVNELKNKLSNSGIYNIAYSVVPKNLQYDIRFYQNYFYFVRIPKYRSFDIKKAYQDINRSQKFIIIKYKKINTFLVNNVLTKVEDLKSTLEFILKDNPNYIIKFYINDNMSFEEYINVLSTSKEAIESLRNEFSLKQFRQEYNLLDYDKQYKIKNSYPLTILELTKEMADTL